MFVIHDPVGRTGGVVLIAYADLPMQCLSNGRRKNLLDRQAAACLLYCERKCMDELYRAIADPTRRAILDELVVRNGQSLYEIRGRLVMKHSIQSTRQAISQHIDVLQDAGLVTSRREGKYKFHWFNGEPLKAITERWPTKAAEKE